MPPEVYGFNFKREIDCISLSQSLMKNDGTVPKNKSRPILLHPSNLLLTLAPSVDDAGLPFVLANIYCSVNQV